MTARQPEEVKAARLFGGRVAMVTPEEAAAGTPPADPRSAAAARAAAEGERDESIFDGIEGLSEAQRRALQANVAKRRRVAQGTPEAAAVGGAPGVGAEGAPVSS